MVIDEMPKAKSIDKLRRDKKEGRHWSNKIHIHKYSKLENGKEICIKCGKSKPLPFFPFGYNVLKLELSCWLWKKRGLKSCKKHGFHAQSYITGKCKKCLISNKQEK